MAFLAWSIQTVMILSFMSKWFRKAMHAGNGLGAYNLALMYYDGSGVDKDEDKAIRIMRKASELGEALADDWLETNT